MQQRVWSACTRGSTIVAHALCKAWNRVMSSLGSTAVRRRLYRFITFQRAAEGPAACQWPKKSGQKRVKDRRLIRQYNHKCYHLN